MEELPKPIKDMVTESFDEAIHCFEVLLENVRSQVKAEPDRFHEGLIMRIMFEQIADHMVAEHDWTKAELYYEMLRD